MLKRVDSPKSGAPRTNHRLWATGAAVLFLAIVASSIHATRPSAVPTSPPPTEAPVAPRPPKKTGGALPCGYCNGDGRIDEADKQRQAPRLDVPPGPCPACEGRGKH